MPARSDIDPKPISVKVTPEARRKIRLAAYLTETTMSAFMRAAAERAAERAIARQSGNLPIKAA